MEEIKVWIIESILSLIAVVLTVFVARILNLAKKRMDDHWKGEEATRLMTQCVYAAEQIYGAGQGQKKREKALSLALSLLKKKGISLPAKEMRILLEATVNEMNQKGKEGRS
jgi:hypothetical protein